MVHIAGQEPVNALLRCFPQWKSARAAVREERPMEHRQLARTGVSVSKLCLGAMMFGDWGNQDHDDSIRIIDRGPTQLWSRPRGGARSKLIPEEGHHTWKSRAAGSTPGRARKI